MKSGKEVNKMTKVEYDEKGKIVKKEKAVKPTTQPTNQTQTQTQIQAPTKNEIKPTVKTQIQIEKVDKTTLPKVTRRNSGLYAQISEQLANLDSNQMLRVIVERRTQAGGLLKFFDKQGYDVVTRKTDDGKIAV
jgi:outer membrane biosynthesis protein TonB